MPQQVTLMDKGTPRLYRKYGDKWVEKLTGADITNKSSIAKLEELSATQYEPSSKLVKDLFNEGEYNFMRAENLSLPQKEILSNLQEKGIVEKVKINAPWDENIQIEVYKLSKLSPKETNNG